MLERQTKRWSQRTRSKLLLSVGFVTVSAGYVYSQHQGQPPDKTVIAKSSQNTDAPAAASVPVQAQAALVPLPQTGPAMEPDAVRPALAADPTPLRVQEETAAPAISPSSALTSSASAESGLNASANTVPSPTGNADLGAMLASSGTSAPSQVPPSSGRYADGEFIGDPADTVWGAVQVKAVIHGGAITDVQFLDYPDHRRRSAEINSWATPMLTSEAIQAQSAQVDIVSQASVTAYGFQQSLASALMHAKK